MDKILVLLLLVLFGGAGLICIFAIINLMLPALVDRTRRALELSPGRSLLLGLVNFVLVALVAGLLTLPTHQGGVLAGICVFLIGLLALALQASLLLGLVAATALLGSKTGAGDSIVRSHLRGGVLLILACLTPYLGWFVITPIVVWTALGATLLALFRRVPSAALSPSPASSLSKPGED